MKVENCDDILMALMAVADGEEPNIGPDLVEAHIAGCESCRSEADQAKAMAGILQNYTRREESAGLWPAIAAPIKAKRPAAWSNWEVFAALALVLMSYKLIEMLPAKDPGYFLKAVPIMAAAALFIFLRENPFKINTELIPER
jgi:predicted anti-sigma-YlaC factor YlaD